MKENNLEALRPNMDSLNVDWMFVKFLNEKAISLILEYGILEKLVMCIYYLVTLTLSIRRLCCH